MAVPVRDPVRGAAGHLDGAAFHVGPEVHAGVTVEDVRANTGFEVQVSDTLTTTKPPSEEELGNTMG